MMYRNLLQKIGITFGLTIIVSIGFSQLTNGSIAPDFTLNDIDGNTHNLYAYLNDGKTVYIDFFAAHCPTCWGYHNQHHLKTLYNEHGPSGTISQDIVVIAIEFDQGNGYNELHGISGSTQGDWVTGTPYPILNPEGSDRTAILNNYMVNYYPMVYAICPNKETTLIGTQTSAILYDHVSSCSTTALYEIGSLEKNYCYYSNKKLIFNIQQHETIQISLYDLQGQKLLEKSVNTMDENIDVSNLSSGIFFYSIEKNGLFSTGKFIIP